MSTNASLVVIQDKRRSKKDKTFPVKLRLSYRRKSFYVPLNISLSEGDFAKVNGTGRVSGKLQEYRNVITETISKANQLVNEVKPFTFDRFKTRLFSTENKSVQTLTDAFSEYIEKLKRRDSLKYASSFGDTFSSINRFWGKAVDFEDISAEWLNDYERWIIHENKNSVTTAGIHTHNIRTIFNYAIYELKIISSDYYPFGKGGYTVPSRLKSKVYLDDDELKKLYEHEVEEGSPRHFYKDIFFFSYFSNGIYLKDIASLMYCDINGDRIEIFRNKIVNTKKVDLKSNIIELNSKSKAIIDRWGNKPKEADQYIFPIYEKGFTEAEKEKKIDYFRSSFNKRLKAMAKECGINKNISSKVARHSFSSQLLRSGESKTFIGEMLAHSNTKTTEHYLHGFPDDIKKKALGKLDIFD